MISCNEKKMAGNLNRDGDSKGTFFGRIIDAIEMFQIPVDDSFHLAGVIFPQLAQVQADLAQLFAGDRALLHLLLKLRLRLGDPLEHGVAAIQYLVDLPQGIESSQFGFGWGWGLGFAQADEEVLLGFRFLAFDDPVDEEIVDGDPGFGQGFIVILSLALSPVCPDPLVQWGLAGWRGFLVVIRVIFPGPVPYLPLGIVPPLRGGIPIGFIPLG